jgi:muramoyltetrapeptide carboxypeptidase
LVAALCGTRDAVAARGRILILEDVGEPAYRVDRMLGQLLRSRALDGVAGLAFGRFTGADDDAAVEDVLRRYAETLGVPAVMGLPFGHTRHNVALPLGARARLDAEEAQLVLLEAGVTRV